MTTLLEFNQTKVIDLLGRRFARLLVVARAPSAKNMARWSCLCDCGGSKVYAGRHLQIGSAKSCGCMPKGPPPRHGQSRTKTYAAWAGMHERCSQTCRRFYKRYAGRGITVCAAWSSFDRFFADMGPAPAGLSIDRIDNDGNYEPGNCRWATLTQQCRNRSSNRILAHDGLSMTVADWAEALGVPSRLLFTRLGLGWSVSDTLTRPVRRFKDRPLLEFQRQQRLQGRAA